MKNNDKRWSKAEYSTKVSVTQLQQHPKLMQQYGTLMTAALEVLSRVDWVAEALAQEGKYAFAPWCAMTAPEGVMGALLPGADAGQDVVCHRLFVEGESWIRTLLHEMRHLWQHTVKHLDVLDESVEYCDRPTEVDARAQEDLVDKLFDQETLQRLNDEAKALDDALWDAVLGLNDDDI